MDGVSLVGRFKNGVDIHRLYAGLLGSTDPSIPVDVSDVTRDAGAESPELTRGRIRVTVKGSKRSRGRPHVS